MLKNLLLWLTADRRIHIIPFTTNKDSKVLPFCIVIKTLEAKNLYEVVWSKLAYFDEEKNGWFWETDNKPVDSQKGLFQPSIESKIKNKVDIEYLTN